ncbi:hypothetical protein BaRGS_00039448 [Batillaria attramentaria]|uniref:Uncharacterized protein n=1 Tax=Batillaria attramentaria TaxID=370345 RepID=A0ABD0J331_9CAEN
MMANEMDQMVRPMSNGHAAPMANGSRASNGARAPMMDMTDEECLDFTCPSHPGELLAAMGSLQRQNQFCDAVLRVGERELEQAALGISMSLVLSLRLVTEAVERSNNLGMLQTLCRAAEDVQEVYRTAKALRMEQATQACSAFWQPDSLPPTLHIISSENSNPLHYLKSVIPDHYDVRKHAEDDVSFREVIDTFIQKNIQQVLTCKHAKGLPELQVEIIGAEEALGQGGSERQLFNLVLEWARNSVDVSKPKIELLTEEVSMLYLNAENHLQDCRDISDATISEDDVVVDYKKHSRRRSTLKNQNHDGVSDTSNLTHDGRPMPFKKFNINPERLHTEREWSIIAILKQSKMSYAGLAVLAGKTMAITVHLRHAATPDPVATGNGCVPMSPEAGDRCASLVPLESMSSCRCAFGVCVVNDTIIVCGGYDRGECLVSAEAYNPASGRWTKLPDMLHPRARVGAAALNGRVYVVGGSDGTRDLNSMDYFDLEKQKWKTAVAINAPRSSVGVAELDGRLYCIGGAAGQRSLDLCEVYSQDSNKWTRIASLNTARYQAAISAYMGGLVAVGGTDSWHCLNSVEMYSPASDTWTYVAPLNNLRRGAGVDVVNNKLWVLGGSDGVSSLRLTEIYDPESCVWTLGPQMNVPRANVSAVSLNGSLYAIEGFSGKKFLNSIEVLTPGSHEWCGYHPAKRSTQQRASDSGELGF